MSGRGKSLATIQQIETCLEILAEIQPASVRAVCYRLFTMGLIPDMCKNSTAKVSRNLVTAREERTIPWQWIVDETREAERVNLWANPEEIIDATVRGYRRDYWQDQPCRVEVWSEKGTVRGTLAPVLREFGVTLRVMHGFGSATAVNDIIETVKASARPMLVFYVGDRDPSGMYMSEVDLPNRLARYGGDAVERVELARLALTADDVEGLKPFDAETKASDARYAWYRANYGTRCWELDAMSPNDLRAKVRHAILEVVDQERWGHAVAIEKAEVASMQRFHAAWSGSLRSAR